MKKIVDEAKAFVKDVKDGFDRMDRGEGTARDRIGFWLITGVVLAGFALLVKCTATALGHLAPAAPLPRPDDATANAMPEPAIIPKSTATRPTTVQLDGADLQTQPQRKTAQVG